MARKKKKEVKAQQDMKDIQGRFIGNIEALNVFVENVHPIAEKQDIKSVKKIERSVKEINKILGIKLKKKAGEKQKNKEDDITDEQIDQITKIAYELKRGISPPQAALLYKSSFVMLMSYFDYLLSDLIQYFFRKYPASLSERELGVTFREIQLFDKINDVIDFVVNKEVENILYNKNLEKQKLYFKNNLKIEIQDDMINWNKINEAMERRHIIAHNDSRINRRYINSVDLSVVPENKKDLKEGERINIHEKYFRNVFEEISVAGIIIIQNCWRKWSKDEAEDADSALNDCIYNELSKERWKIAERLGLFSKICKVCKQQDRLYLDINYCQSLKWQGKKEELERELKKFDLSSLRPIYILAIHALKSDRENFYGSIENAVKVDDMIETQLMEWPLFRELKKDKEYEARIKSVFSSMTEKETGKS